MVEPITSNKNLIVPSTGDLVGSWGTAAMNPNFNAIDGMFGGAITVSLAGTTAVALGGPSGTTSPASGPTQAQNALITFSGALTANCSVSFPLPGFYIVNNRCTGNFAVIMGIPGASGTNQLVSAPPGQLVYIFNDGSNLSFVDMPAVGSLMDLCVATTPPWILNCSVAPWLVCDGTVYNNSNYTALGTLLGSTFGGNGVSTFGVPDLRARARIPLDNQGSQGAAGRVTAAGAGINGTTLGASGGSQFLHGHNHSATDSTGHNHTMAQDIVNNGSAQSRFFVTGGGAGAGVTSTTFVNITIGVTGAGASQNVQPTLVHGMTFVKT